MSLRDVDVLSVLIRIPWTTVLGILVGVFTAWLVGDSMNRMEASGADYGTFTREFISLSLLVETFVFGFFMAYASKDRNCYAGSAITAMICGSVIPFSIILSIITLTGTWEGFDFDSIKFYVVFTTLIIYSAVYSVSLKITRAVLFEDTSS